MRAPPSPTALVGPLGSARDDLRRPVTCAQPPSTGAAAAARGDDASLRRWVGKEEALRELREETTWSAWMEEGSYGGGAGLYCCQRT
jgi:hypothetical protein